jgi:SpoVK/Ycf46/Vps4 family AAA+-type ATPase
VTRFDVLVSSYLGETSGNLRKVFDYASERPAVLFFDEFDAVARSRDDESEHGELKRVVNALLQLVDRFDANGFVLAATNYEGRLDPAIWRRFDEVVFFDKPTLPEIRALLTIKLKNFPTEFEPSSKAERLQGFSHAEIERVCLNAVKQAILKKRNRISTATFDRAMAVEEHRRAVVDQLNRARESCLR